MAYAGKIKILGYGFYKGKKGFALRVHAKSKAKMKARVRELTSRKTVNDYEKWKVDLKRYVVGWVNYCKLADMGKYLQSVDVWMRRRIRMVFWKKWKRVRTRWRNLLRLGQHRTMGAAGFGGSFAPIVQYEKWEIHRVFPHFPYFRWGQNLTPNLLAPLCGVALGISNANEGILANSRKGYWRIASSPILQTALSNKRLEKAGFQFFYSYYRKSVAA